VFRFMPPKPRKPSSQTWRTSLHNHAGSLASGELASIEFFAVHISTFRVLDAHVRRRVLRFNVTELPSAQWTGIVLVCKMSECRRS